MDRKLYTRLVAVRRTIHANPELGYRENETAALVCKELDVLGIPFTRNIAKTGVVGIIKKGAGETIALRADMDALPIREENDLDFKSTKEFTTRDNVSIPLM